MAPFCVSVVYWFGVEGSVSILVDMAGYCQGVYEQRGNVYGVLGMEVFEDGGRGCELFIMVEYLIAYSNRFIE